MRLRREKNTITINSLTHFHKKEVPCSGMNNHDENTDVGQKGTSAEFVHASTLGHPERMEAMNIVVMNYTKLNVIKSNSHENYLQGVHTLGEGEHRKKGTPIQYMISPEGCFEIISHALNKDGYPGIFRNGKDLRMSRYI